MALKHLFFTFGSSFLFFWGGAFTSQADTVQVDLSSYTSYSTVAYNLQSGVTADSITEWLADANNTWYATGYNGETSFNPWGDGTDYPVSITGNDNGSVDITNFIVRKAAGGSAFGTKISLDDSSYQDYSGLTFSVTLNSSTNSSLTLTSYLVYQTSEGWQLVSSESETGVVGSTYSVTADLSETSLVSNEVYVVTTATQVYNALEVTTALIAETVPEPATATLGLLGLAGLAMRRRRKQ